MRFDYNDTVRVYLKAMNWVVDLMSAVPECSLATSTPCADFDVRSLSGHLLGTAERRSTREIPHVIIDVPGAMLTQRFGELAGHIRAAWSAVEPGDLVVAPWGQCSALDVVGGFTVETLVHGWDLAIATDQPSEAPAGLADAVNAHVDRVIPETTPEQDVRPGMALGGRCRTDRAIGELIGTPPPHLTRSRAIRHEERPGTGAHSCWRRRSHPIAGHRSACGRSSSLPSR